MTDSFLLYGSYGYTGALIAGLAVQRGMRPLLAGRDPQRLQAQAERLGLDWRAFVLDDRPALEAALAETGVVLHCGGPFHRTYRAMAEACLSSGRHYLDITGEGVVFAGLMEMDAAARERGVMLLPGAGFDVVPTDCLALHLKQRLPEATHLTLAVAAIGGGVSHGTALSTIENAHHQTLTRMDGKLVRTRIGARTRQMDFGEGLRQVVSAPLADVYTAYASTGIPNIDTYLSLSPSLNRVFRLAGRLRGLTAAAWIQTPLRRLIRSMPEGPSPESRRQAHVRQWGEVSDSQGRRAAARQVTPEGYSITAETALEIARRAVSGDFQPGFQTPAAVYGADFILGFAGVTREDLPSQD